MIDELNIINKNNGIEQRIRSYFKKMPMISEKQIEERTDFAKKIFDLIMLFFLMADANREMGNIQDIDYYIAMITRRYEDDVEDSFGMAAILSEYISAFAQNMVNNTFENLDDERTLSEDRAFDISVNESNTTLGQYEYQQAIKSGKTMKQWISEHDMRVRNSHMIVDGTEIPIKQYFHVGASLMLYPHDAVNGDAKEVVNCRCHIEYL